MEKQAFIGRQPIMDVNQKIIGYELFFRKSADATVAELEDNIQAYANVLTNAMNEMDNQWLLGDKLAFINVNEVMLNSEFLELMPANRTVLEILRDVPSNDEVIARLQELRTLGYKIALDNPHLRQESQALLPCADYIKIDIQSIKPTEAVNIFAQFQTKTAKVVAEKIETIQQFEACKKFGATLFQGFYFARPDTFVTEVLNPSFDSVLNLLNLLTQDAEMQDLEAGFKRDAALSFKLLRYINSVGFGLAFEIQSIQHALSTLGRVKLYRWLTLLMVTAGESSTPPALMKTAITRGRLVELLGASFFEKKDLDNLFIVGIFSLLDAIVRMPMEVILERIQLPEAVLEALLKREGVYGPFLQLTEACEGADSQRIIELSELLQMEASEVNKCHIAALAWVETLGV